MRATFPGLPKRRLCLAAAGIPAPPDGYDPLMFNEIEGALKRAASGEIDSNALGQAAEQHVQSADPQAVQSQMQTAANNAQQNGQPGLAQQIMSMLQQHKDDPQALKSDLITLVKNNPQVLQHFQQEFAQKILSRV